jgi:lysophospholipase
VSFTREQARRLHDSLAAFDLKSPVVDDELTRAYLRHYGLAHLQAPWPLTHFFGSFTSGPFRLAGQFFAVPPENCRGTVVIVHGYYDHTGLFCHPIELCLSLGFSVLSFDLPGHGLSSGDPASISSFDYYSQALVDCLRLAGQAGAAGPWSILGQSTGAAAIINCLLDPQRYPLPAFHKILLLAPLLQPVDWASGLVKYRFMRWFVKRVKRDFARNSHDDEFLHFIAGEDPLQARYLMVDWVRSLKAYLDKFAAAPRSQQPLHIIQGTEDTTVDWRYNLPKLVDKFPAARTYLIEGARHHLVNESDQYRQQVFKRIAMILTQ